MRRVAPMHRGRAVRSLSRWTGGIAAAVFAATGLFTALAAQQTQHQRNLQANAALPAPPRALIPPPQARPTVTPGAAPADTSNPSTSSSPSPLPPCWKNHKKAKKTLTTPAPQQQVAPPAPSQWVKSPRAQSGGS